MEVEVELQVPLVALKYLAYALLVALEGEELLHALLKMVVVVVELRLVVRLEEEGEVEPQYSLLEVLEVDVGGLL
jgi:hypothetical protein